jgi:hypothetical protein
MLSDEAFLRNLPRCLDLGTRLRLEAIVTSYDIASFAFRQLCQLLEDVGSQPEGYVFATRERIQAAMLSWTIVDHLHNVRQLTKPIQAAKEALLRFSQSVETATLMRNYMDHLFGNIGNLASMKGSSLPLHGFISFYLPATPDGYFDNVNFPLGGLQHAKQHSAAIDTWAAPPKAGVGDVNFAAFDLQINFSAAVAAMEETISTLNETCLQSARSQITDVAGSLRQDPDELLNNTVSGSYQFRLRLRSPSG